MWIAFRIIIGLVAFAVRQLYRARKPKSDGIENGRATYQRVHTQKGTIKGFTLGVAVNAPLAFTLSRETGRDRFFKKLGLSAEMESGDRAFDDFVYVMCDHPMLGQLLKRSAAARDAIRAVLTDDFKHIRFDGHVVWVEKAASRTPSDEEERMVGALGEAFAPLEHDRSGRFSDAFLWKALVVEGVVWSIVGYAVASLFSMFGQQEDIHLAQAQVMWRGTLLAGVLFALLAALTWALMRGSSRGHRIILESGVLLLLALPPTGWQAYADLNRGLDSTRTEIRVAVTQCETRVSRSRRGTTTNYYLHLRDQEVDGVELPRTLKTNATACFAVTPRVPARLVLGRGALGLPWIRELAIGAYSWKS
jgi:hypothetical protein